MPQTSQWCGNPAVESAKELPCIQTSKGTAAGQTVLRTQSRRAKFPKALHLPEGLRKVCSKSSDSIRKREGQPRHRGRYAPNEFMENKICRFQSSEFNPPENQQFLQGVLALTSYYFFKYFNLLSAEMNFSCPYNQVKIYYLTRLSCQIEQNFFSNDSFEILIIQSKFTSIISVLFFWI